MKYKMIYLALVAATCALCPQANAQTLTSNHVPPSTAVADQPLHLDFAIAPASLLTSATVQWRPAGGGAWHEAPIKMAATGRLRATLPAAAMTDPGVDYHVVLNTTDGAAVAAFASANEPHRVVVRGQAGKVQRETALLELNERRSELEIAGQWVEFNTFGGGGTSGPDYHDASLRFRHWLLSGVEYIEFGVGSLRGQALPTATYGVPATGRVAVGFDRGWAQLGFRFSERVGGYGRLLLGGDEMTFRVGAAAGVRIGRPRQTRLILETGMTGGVGAHLLAAFHLDTVERWPLAVEVQLDNLPNDNIEVAERVRFRLGHEISESLVAELVATYQAQRHEDHGFGAGAKMTLRF